MIDCVIRKQIERVNFRFYTDADVRVRSVCEITSSVSTDALGTPLPNGVYDPRLGPSRADDPPCPTCAQRFLACPGHFGHIELCVPLYHPLLFSKLVELMRMKCLQCHKLTLAPRQLEVFKMKFRLLNCGRYNDALMLDDRLAAVAKESKLEKGDAKGAVSIQAAGAKFDAFLKEIADSLDTSSSHEMTTFEDAHFQRLAKEMMSACKGAKNCPHCGAFSPKIRQDSSNKIFQSPLSATAARMNEAEGLVIQPALGKKSLALGSNGESDDDDMDVDETDDKGTRSSRDKYMHPSEVKAQVERTWSMYPALCAAIFAVQGSDIFFLQSVAVPPNRFRPPMHLGGMVVEHAQNVYLNKMITSNELIRASFVNNNEAVAYKHWIDLQTHVNCFMDSSKDPSLNQNVTPGIRQLLERKEGIFRKHMMGKRVNFACRSVISPDPYIGTNEIGIPHHFVKTLTYPTPVTDINLEEMKSLVERGPDNYPGARWVEFPDRRVDLSKMDQHKREAIAARLLVSVKKGGQPAIVGRQMRDGDMVLMNRQPTLHKPGIMAHEVRVLHDPTQKTIRMHYANCNTYNADYDGDEMNCHFPQSDLARAEASYIAKTDFQFIVPTDGSPLRGLIQDHVVAGVKLTKRDTFLEKWEYQQLLFATLASLPRLEVVRSDSNIELMPPAVLKPRPLWTGKQVISTLLNHLRKANDREYQKDALPGLSTERKTKTPAAAFGAEQEEHLVLIRDGELLRGVLDKAAFGSTDFSLVHAVYEAYGPSKASLLLNSLGRLFTAYLQYYSGHSCRMEDLVLTHESDGDRRALIHRAYTMGSRAAKAWADSEGGKVKIDLDESQDTVPLKPVEAAAAAAKVRQLLSGNEGKANSASYDGFMMSKLNPLASSIVKKCLPGGLAVPFPANTFGIMVTTGAKGSIVNQSQVTCALGQQALEGRRVPRMSSGRTLPSFAPFDVNPRADGFVMDRFLTGIRPQEYYFHCMAGREGLVDTAVKTSRSGYLQRCLVKHLEELKVCYDYTVRNGEGGVVQFLYGEDGLDPTKASYLDCSKSSFAFMARNGEALGRAQVPLGGASIDASASDATRSKQLAVDSDPKLKVGDFVRARRLRFGNTWTRGAICEGWNDAVIVGKGDKKKTFNIKYLKDDQVEKNVPVQTKFEKRATLCTTCVLIKPAVADPIVSSSRKGHRLGTSGACVSERIAEAASSMLESEELKQALRAKGVSKKDFGSLVAAKYGSALCAPGEAVGSIAAQSIGEPSTQMTLNTFHLAGAGANVTLGIPRLREIIMTASRVLKTPTMSVPLLESVNEAEATRLTRSFTKLSLNELIAGHQGVMVRETLVQDESGLWQRAYYVTLKLHPAERIQTAFGLSLKQIGQVVAKSFVPALSAQMKLELRRSATEGESIVEVEGGESSTIVHSKHGDADDDDEVSQEPTKSKSKKAEVADLFDEEADDDDESVDVVAEDGVNANRKQGESYGMTEDDDDNSISSSESTNDDPKGSQTESNGGRPSMSKFESSDYGVRVDEDNNLIHLQPLRVDPSARPLLMVGLVEKAAVRTLVRSRKNIDQAFVNDEEGGRGRCLQTAGINFSEIWQLEQVKHDLLLSNDIWAIRCSYGVEAARRNIVEQIRAVFGVYGIEVDPRHLSLIADYMTFSGDYTPMNRTGMREMSSPFLQMSFETTAQFLTQAALTASSDALKSPSSNIVVGRPIQHGTGAFSLLMK